MTSPAPPVRPASTSAAEPIVVRDLRPRDVDSLCTLLTASFRREYEEQGLDVWGFRRHYRLVAWANLVLAPLGLDFFQVVVAVAGRRVVGTMGSFPADRGAWYQGFGAVDPELRRRGVYKRVIRRSLERIAARGARWGGGEIRCDNAGALRPYRDVFGTEVLPVQRVYLAPADPAAVSAPASPAPAAPAMAVRAATDRDLDRLPAAAAVRRRFRGGFLVERETRRGLAACLLRWLLPPITVRSYLVGGPGEPPLFARARTHWPAMIVALDAVEVPPGWAPERVRDALLALLGRLARRGRPPLRIYVGEGDDVLAAACEGLGFSLLASLYPIRTDVARALAATDRAGERLPAPAAGGAGSAGGVGIGAEGAA